MGDNLGGNWSFPLIELLNLHSNTFSWKVNDDKNV
jgi:hypothetical protein